MKKHRKVWRCALAAALLTVLAATGLLQNLDNLACDALYQQPGAADGQILVIGMDQPSLEELGPLPWPREYVARVIENLNADAENAPAVIGIDVLYAGQTTPEADARLAQAAKAGGNVVVAGAARYGSRLEVSGDAFRMDPGALLDFEFPYTQLLQSAAAMGHINAMADSDGYLRHALFAQNQAPESSVIIYPMAYQAYALYAAFHGQEVDPGPATQEGFFYLPYTAEPGGYDSGVSFADALRGDFDPQLFAGKIVLIGPYAAGLQDEYHTAISHAVPMYGVEVLANQIDAYRAGFYPREVSNILQLGLLFAASFALCLLLWDRRVKSSLLLWLGTTAVWVAACYGVYRAGGVLHALWFPLAGAALFVGSMAANYIRASREKRRVTATFGRYVDPAVLGQLLQEGAESQLVGQTRDIAVLFVDIRGFTAMSEALPPETVVQILNQYLTLTTRCIMRYRGTLDKFVGDCTMAFWNAPLPQQDPVYLACKAAMDMVAESEDLGRQLQERYGYSVSFGIGIHWGSAVVGNIGAPQRLDYTAIGDTVNTAARLEANAPGGAVLISRSVAEALGSRASVTSLGSGIPLKGKAEGFEVLTLDSLE